MGYTKASTEDVDSAVPDEWGGMWFLRNVLETEKTGVTVLELEAGGKGKRHDHAGDDQEEVYLVVDGRLEVDLADETVALAEHEALRVDPDEERQLHNRSDELARVVIVGTP